MTADDHDTDRPKDEPGFVRTVLSDLFDTIADMDDRDQRRRSGTGTARNGNTRFDYGFDVGIGPGTDTDERRETHGTRPAETDTDNTAAVQPTEDGCVVTLDLPDVDPHGLSAGVDSGVRTLVVADDGGVVARVSLPDGGLDVGTASYNNGVLDVRLDATEGSE